MSATGAKIQRINNSHKEFTEDMSHKFGHLVNDFQNITGMGYIHNLYPKSFVPKGLCHKPMYAENRIYDFSYATCFRLMANFLSGPLRSERCIQ